MRRRCTIPRAFATVVQAAARDADVRCAIVSDDRARRGAQPGATHSHEPTALLLWLGDRSSESDLLPPIGSPDRPRVYTWATWLTNTVMSAYARLDGSDAAAASSDVAAAIRVVAERDLINAMEFIEDRLRDRDHLVGDRCTIADLLLYAVTDPRTSAVAAAVLPEHPRLSAHRDRIAARPSVMHAESMHLLTGDSTIGVTQPLVEIEVDA